MVFGTTNLRDTYQPLLRHLVWQQLFNWLKRLPASPTPGITQIRGDEIYVNVHGYETSARTVCRFESHRTYVDLQYCISGGEIIEWHPTPELRPRDEYNSAKDVVHYDPPATPAAQLRMTVGSFAVFFPEDGHMPKLNDGMHPRVDKLVIKIARSLLD